MIHSLTYLWIDSDNHFRTKVRTLELNSGLTTIDQIPKWSFELMSINHEPEDQNYGILCPVAFYQDPFGGNNEHLVWCECTNLSEIPLPSNHRWVVKSVFEEECVLSEEPSFSLEQEYLITRKDIPLGWKYPPKKLFDSRPLELKPIRSGDHYCSTTTISKTAKKITRKHYLLCLKAGIKITGYEARPMSGQWSFKIGPVDALLAGDDLWVARYLLEQVALTNGCRISYSGKPINSNWSGSGLRVCFNTRSTQNLDGNFQDWIEKLEQNSSSHMEMYGNNQERLKDVQVESLIRESLRIDQNQLKYLEDHRPSADADPYLVMGMITETILSQKNL